MKLFFVLGRNPVLSHLEVMSYLEARDIEFEEVLFEENLLVLDLPDSFNLDIQRLGGVIKIGKITFESSSEKDFEKFLDKEDIIPSDKFSYSVFGNMEPDLLKDKFKREKRKAVLKHGREDIKFQGNIINRLPKGDYSLFLFQDESSKKIYFGISNQEYDHTDVEIRDMKKPVRRESLAISPRLSKILINLSGVKEGQNLLDPFCGIAGIIQEALVEGINSYGIDKDKEAIEGAKKNIAWLKETYKINAKVTLQNLDSRNAPDNQFDGIATETPLGILLKKKPTDKEAAQVIKDFEYYIVPILRRLKEVKKKAAKIAITFPAIKSFRVDLSKVTRESGLKILHEPILESRPDQFISREILVLK